LKLTLSISALLIGLQRIDTGWRCQDSCIGRST